MRWWTLSADATPQGPTLLYLRVSGRFGPTPVRPRMLGTVPTHRQDSFRPWVTRGSVGWGRNEDGLTGRRGRPGCTFVEGKKFSCLWGPVVLDVKTRFVCDTRDEDDPSLGVWDSRGGTMTGVPREVDPRPPSKIFRHFGVFTGRFTVPGTRERPPGSSLGPLVPPFGTRACSKGLWSRGETRFGPSWSGGRHP